ncbi:MAG TPA: arginine--tRNA ligase [Solirubrobacterales bacterium]|jgi:arginyl-tRNA synthetase
MGNRGAENVLDAVQAVLDGHGLDGVRVSVPHHPGRRDLSLFGLGQASPDDAESAVRELQALDSIESVSTGKREKVGVRLSSGCVAELGEMLESGEEGAVWTGDLLAGREVLVNFCDPNATKALHIGHLRNIAIGNAVAAILRSCGAQVTTQSQVGDVGRSVGEAMAGYEQRGDGGGSPPRGEKSDHFVGSCYSDYVMSVEAAGRGAEGLASDPALSREDEERDDLASELIERWRDGDPETVAVWRKIRDWVVDGHEQTLGRLNVSIDRLLFESEYLGEIDAVGDRLVETEVATETPGGAALYPTGDPSYPQLVLRRPDGHSTQYLRYLGLWNAIRPNMGSAESIQVMGDEWLSLARSNDRLLGCLAEGEEIHPSQCLVHGMVAVENQVVKSSLAAPWLADELLDEIAVHPEVERETQGDRQLAERISAITVLGMFIADSPEKRLSISREALFNPASNPGWALALGARAAWDRRFDGAPDPLPSDRDYRFLVAQSQVHRRLMQRSAAELNPVHLVRFHAHLCQWFLQSEQTPRLARAMRTMTSSGIASLGMPPLVDAGAVGQPA